MIKHVRDAQTSVLFVVTHLRYVSLIYGLVVRLKPKEFTLSPTIQPIDRDELFRINLSKWYLNQSVCHYILRIWNRSISTTEFQHLPNTYWHVRHEHVAVHMKLCGYRWYRNQHPGKSALVFSEVISSWLRQEFRIITCETSPYDVRHEWHGMMIVFLRTTIGAINSNKDFWNLLPKPPSFNTSNEYLELRIGFPTALF